MALSPAAAPDCAAHCSSQQPGAGSSPASSLVPEGRGPKSENRSAVFRASILAPRSSTTQAARSPPAGAAPVSLLAPEGRGPEAPACSGGVRGPNPAPGVATARAWQL